MRKQETLETYVSPGIKVAEVSMKSLVVASEPVWTGGGSYVNPGDGEFEW